MSDQSLMEDTIDQEFMPQVQEIDAESILRRMDT